jgi:hypothetical protein
LQSKKLLFLDFFSFLAKFFSEFFSSYFALTTHQDNSGSFKNNVWHNSKAAEAIETRKYKSVFCPHFGDKKNKFFVDQFVSPKKL